MKSLNKNSEPNKNIIEELKQLLGNDVVLLPIPSEKKGPILKGWQNITIEKMSDPQYLASLNHGNNIGVLLGEKSGDIITIDIDSDDEVEPFLKLNPTLRETLRTRRERGCNLWVQIKGDYPASGKIENPKGKAVGEWRATGCQTVIHGAARDKESPHNLRSYVFLNKVPPIEIEFEDIVWPVNWVLPWKQESKSKDVFAVSELGDVTKKLKQLYGEPWYENGEGIFQSIGEAFWAGLYHHENLVLFEPEEEQFYQYNVKRGLWQVISEAAIRHAICKRLLDASRESNLPALERQRSQSKLSAILNHLRGIAERRGAFENKPRIVHVANGVIKFENGDIQFTEFSPDYYSRNQSPIAYNPNDCCPRFLNELLYPSLLPEDASLFQRYAGLALFGYNLPQRFLILDGGGGKGKTTLVNVIQSLIGVENCSQLRTEHLTKQFEIFRFSGMTLLIGSDVPGDFMMQKGTSSVKALVGGDFLSAEGKNCNGNFRFRGIFNLIITANERLRLRLQGDADAWRRRLLIARFENPAPVKKIPNFADLLIREEGSGILNWALAGLAKLLKEIDETGDFELTINQKARIDALLAESESLRMFLNECVIRQDSSDITTNELVECYAHFCADRGWNPMPITIVHRELPELMLELFRVTQSNSIERKEKKSNRGYRNVSFKV